MADDKKIVDLKEAKALREKSEARAKSEAEPRGPSDSRDEITSAFVLSCLMASEMGDGMLYAALLRDKFVFNKSADKWMRWTGHHWDLDILDRAEAAVEVVARKYLEEATYIGSKGDIKTVFTRIKKIRETSGRKSCLKMAHTHEVGALAIRGDEIDKHPWLLACANGVVDLRTGKFGPGRPGDYLCKACPVEWKGIDEPTPIFYQALLEILSGDNKMAEYLQRGFGYAITGLDTEHILPVFHGQGRNGKGLLVKIISYVLGTLAGPIPSEMFLDQGRYRASGAPTSDIMALRGMRIGFASETDEDRRISPARVKWLSGGDPMVGRNPNDKYQVSFDPTHTLFLLTNHKPHAPASDFAFWERVHLVLFELSFVDREPKKDNERRADKNLWDKIKPEASGILAWLVRGCLLWQQQGLDPPAKVIEATHKYQRDEDLIGDFIDECCEKGEDFEEGSTDLYTAFEEWWKRSISKHPYKHKKWGRLMKAKFESIKTGGKYRYYGLRLISDQHSAG